MKRCPIFTRAVADRVRGSTNLHFGVFVGPRRVVLAFVTAYQQHMIVDSSCSNEGTMEPKSKDNEAELE